MTCEYKLGETTAGLYELQKMMVLLLENNSFGTFRRD